MQNIDEMSSANGEINDDIQDVQSTTMSRRRNIFTRPNDSSFTINVAAAFNSPSSAAGPRRMKIPG